MQTFKCWNSIFFVEEPTLGTIGFHLEPRMPGDADMPISRAATDGTTAMARASARLSDDQCSCSWLRCNVDRCELHSDVRLPEDL